jgi:site-specific recombinase XerD
LLTKYQVRFQRDLLTKFLYSKRPNLSPSTFTLYEYCLKSFVERYEISADGINSFLANLNCGIARGNYHQIITTFIRWLLKTGHLEDNPMDRVNKPRRAKRILTSVTEEQVQLLLGQVDNRRDRAIISLLFSSGMRLNELTNI